MTASPGRRRTGRGDPEATRDDGDADGRDPRDPMRQPGDLPRPGDPDRPHDPRRKWTPARDDRKPAGDESTRPDEDDRPRIDPKGRAPLPRLPRTGRPEPVD